MKNDFIDYVTHHPHSVGKRTDQILELFTRYAQVIANEAEKRGRINQRKQNKGVHIIADIHPYNMIETRRKD